MKRCEFADSEKLLPQYENIMEYIASNTNLLLIAYKILFDIPFGFNGLSVSFTIKYSNNERNCEFIIWV